MHDDGLPRDAEGMRLMLNALVDGELDAAAALAVERRIAADPALAAEHGRLVALRGAFARLPAQMPSDDFLARIAAIGRAEAAGAVPVASDEVRPTQPLAQPQAGARRPASAARGGAWRLTARRFGGQDWRALAASMVVGAVLASGATQWLMVAGAPDSLAVAVADGHRRSLLAASPIDIVSTDRHTVKPWLDARVGLSPPAPDLAQDGFTLIGGRVEVVANRAVPALVYRHREHLITVVAVPQDKGGVVAPADLSAEGFSMVKWSDGAFGYFAISDMERPELDDFVGRFRAAAR
ncbi:MULTISPECIES: anti-sigma factor [unclassified Mesorhizobium]|mgnify:CR=1 FL=1|uniref:anti-sigma factor family protein n=1 Tax=unclassified Mesorhizobium TaxID=325217 RepID=UPI00086AD494|nr:MULTISPECIES: anti-sigma factor [unclassified Mesorhizobium]MBN9253429.1 anti-sigma factor [Mesorhizobium sp.]MBN9270099.1 anti-sigma factor [Mesorhizobium sp.]ODT14125.1 MAG: anti-sigma factor [Mesorhizobium sp. SCN 65-12]OJX82122.1 MAG: anti-sigma factor [Mesorhizobium sp. 65-26]